VTFSTGLQSLSKRWHCRSHGERRPHKNEASRPTRVPSWRETEITSSSRQLWIPGIRKRQMAQHRVYWSPRLRSLIRRATRSEHGAMKCRLRARAASNQHRHTVVRCHDAASPHGCAERCHRHLQNSHAARSSPTGNSVKNASLILSRHPRWRRWSKPRFHVDAVKPRFIKFGLRPGCGNQRANTTTNDQYWSSHWNPDASITRYQLLFPSFTDRKGPGRAAISGTRRFHMLRADSCQGTGCCQAVQKKRQREGL